MGKKKGKRLSSLDEDMFDSYDGSEYDDYGGDTPSDSGESSKKDKKINALDEDFFGYDDGGYDDYDFEAPKKSRKKKGKRANSLDDDLFDGYNDSDTDDYGGEQEKKSDSQGGGSSKPSDSEDVPANSSGESSKKGKKKGKKSDSLDEDVLDHWDELFDRDDSSYNDRYDDGEYGNFEEDSRKKRKKRSESQYDDSCDEYWEDLDNDYGYDDFDYKPSDEEEEERRKQEEDKREIARLEEELRRQKEEKEREIASLKEELRRKKEEEERELARLEEEERRKREEYERELARRVEEERRKREEERELAMLEEEERRKQEQEERARWLEAEKERRKHDAEERELALEGSAKSEKWLGAALTLFEILLIFGVFAAYGAWPVPDVNEQYYVGKAIHFWNHDWLGHDKFLNTPDSHWLFYCVFGLLSFVFKQNTLVWVGRCCVWFATACAWRRLSYSLLNLRWVAVLTAAAFAFYLDTFHLAGEWIFGGVEGKALAFPFVFWGLACYFEGKYNRAWILLGIASAFHVLVGGWVVLALLLVSAASPFFKFDEKESKIVGTIAILAAALKFSLLQNKVKRLAARSRLWNKSSDAQGVDLRFSSRLIDLKNKLRLKPVDEDEAVFDVFESDKLEKEVNETLANVRAANDAEVSVRVDELQNALGQVRELLDKERPCVRENLRIVLRNILSVWGLFLGGAIALLGLIPALALDAGASSAELALSRQIYVFDRLAHHLVASSLPWTFQLRFIGMVFLLGFSAVLFWTLLYNGKKGVFKGWEDDRGSGWLRLYLFAGTAALIACIGACIDYGSLWLESIGALETHKTAAGLLRYYWYRLSDWAIPLALIFSLTGILIQTFNDYLVFNKERFWGAFFAWLAGGLGVYWFVRFCFYREAVSVAAGQAVDGLVPLPKPTEALAFITCLAAIGGIITIAAFVLKVLRKEYSLPNWLTSGLWVWILVAAAAAPLWRAASYVDLRGTKMIPRSAPPKESIADGWLDACHWCRDNTDAKAVFLVPRGCDSFKWEAQRAEAGSWKEIPQDAKSIVQWNKKMKKFYANPNAEPGTANYWNQPLVGVFINKGRAAVVKEAKKYGYQYAVVETPPYVIATIPEALKRWREFEKNDLVYQNDQFIVLKFDRSDEQKNDAKKEENKDENKDEKKTDAPKDAK